MENLDIDREQQAFEYANAKPIPLTEEWLLKFGFCKDKNEYRNDIVCGYFIFNSLNKVFDYVVEGISITFVKYVHEIQNLIFALTGEEIEIKEEAENLTE